MEKCVHFGGVQALYDNLHQCTIKAKPHLCDIHPCTHIDISYMQYWCNTRTYVGICVLGLRLACMVLAGQCNTVR